MNNVNSSGNNKHPIAEKTMRRMVVLLMVRFLSVVAHPFQFLSKVKTYKSDQHIIPKL